MSVAANYYDRKRFAQQQRAQAIAEEAAKRPKPTSYLSNGPGHRPKLEVVRPTKERLHPKDVSEMAAEAIRERADEAYVMIENTLKWANIPSRKGGPEVFEPFPDYPHLKETIVGRVKTGENSYLLVSMVNFEAQRVNVLPDGKLQYLGVAIPKDGDPVDQVRFPVRGVRKNANGGFEVDPHFTAKGIAWTPKDATMLADGCLKAAKAALAAEARGQRQTPKPSIAQQNKGLIAQHKEHETRRRYAVEKAAEATM